MIVTFSVENWRSFKEKCTLNMVATREAQHRERLPHIPKQSIRLSPIASIYGANASGKSKLIEALSFLQDFIVSGVRPDETIDVQPFKLDLVSYQNPTRFWISILVDDLLYSYYISLNKNQVLEEHLEVENSKSVYTLFKRNQDSSMTFCQKKFTEEAINFLTLIGQSTRKNIPFLTNIFNQNIGKHADIFKPVYNWFKNSLTIIGPKSNYLGIQRFTDKEDEYYAELNQLLFNLDTGIDHLESKPIENNALRSFIQNASEITGKGAFRFGDTVIVYENGEIRAQRVFPIHKTNGNNFALTFADESLGTQRLFDIIPMFLDLKNSVQSRVYVIDELENSLHTKLLTWLITYYLAKCDKTTRNQLIFTTHDVNLLTQKIFRRDELWLVEKNRNGESSLYSIGEFDEIRNDKDIRKLYLNGLVGGVPRIIG